MGEATISAAVIGESERRIAEESAEVVEKLADDVQAWHLGPVGEWTRRWGEGMRHVHEVLLRSRASASSGASAPESPPEHDEVGV